MKEVKKVLSRPDERRDVEKKMRKLKEARRKMEQIERGRGQELIYKPDARSRPTDIRYAAEELKRIRDQMDKLK